MSPRLVDLAQQAVGSILKPGQHALDATLGNGFDCLFLARCVGSQGLVYGFDPQRAALTATQKRLLDAGLASCARLFPLGHELMLDALPPGERGQIQAVMFNLGYLPGGNRELTTRPETSLQALDAAAQLLAPDGAISVIAYTGHPGGREETEVVMQWAEALNPTRWRLYRHPVPAGRTGSPEWIWIQRR